MFDWPVIREEHWYRVNEHNIAEIPINVFEGEVVVMTEGAWGILTTGWAEADGDWILLKASEVEEVMRAQGFDRL